MNGIGNYKLRPDSVLISKHMDLKYNAKWYLTDVQLPPEHSLSDSVSIDCWVLLDTGKIMMDNYVFKYGYWSKNRHGVVKYTPVLVPDNLY